MATPKEFPDPRLASRYGKILERLDAEPGESFPTSMKTGAELEAFYRFVSNERIGSELLIGQAVLATLERVSGRKDAVVAHDTTEFHYSTERDGTGRLCNGGHGFFGHFSLAIGADEGREVLGAVGMLAHTRGAARKPKHSEHLPEEQRESMRWWKGVELAEEELGGATSCIHVMDREADSYALLAKLQQKRHRFVIRISHDRRLGKDEYLFSSTTKFPALLRRDVELSARKARQGKTSNKSRTGRVATLEISVGRVTLPRAEKLDLSLPSSLELNVVHVREVNPPDNAEPVDWKLYTLEDVSTAEAAERVVDWYRARWRIEEFFKALKTGCDVEGRQLETLDALLNAIALLTPVAANLLRLRSEGRERPEAAPTVVLTPLQIALLGVETKLKKDASLGDAMYAVARLGGHLKRNGPPGWQTLAKGYLKLLYLEAGALAFKQLQL